MMNWLKKGWTILPAGVILYFGVQRFLEKLPTTTVLASVHGASAGSSDSLLIRLAREFKLQRDTAVATSSLENPFHGVRLQPSPGQSAALPKPEPPIRKLILKGTVGSEVATITSRSGQSRIVRVGDEIDSATVISISANRVTLKDRAGKFELTADK